MFSVVVDVSAINGMLSNATKQIPFATSLALNKLGNAAVVAERKGLEESMHIRRKWTLLGIDIVKKADKANLVCIVGVLPDRAFLSQYEYGGQRTPLTNKYSWVPNAEVFQHKIITSADPLNPSNLRFVNGRGPNGTSLILNSGHPLVLQRSATTSAKTGRVGKGKRGHNAATGNRVLYTLVKRTHMPASLRFITTVSNIVTTQWAGMAQEAVAQALKTAK